MGATATAQHLHEPEPDRTGATGRSTGGRRALQAVLLALPVAWIAAMAWTHRWMTEDGFIYLRIVRQIGEGNGPVFNQGERVEAFTGVLWVGVLAIADLLLPIRLEWLTVLIGLLGTAGAVALAILGSRRLWAGGSGGDAVSVPLGAVVFVALFPVWAYATSGLETGLVFTWLGACLWILASWARDPDERVSGPGALLLGLGWLVRPEMVLFSAAFLLVVVGSQWSRDSWRSRARFIAAALAVPVAYQVFRMGYFGSLVANTAIAKEGTDGNVERGWAYFSDFAGPYWLWVPVLGLVAGGYAPLLANVSRSGNRRRGVVAATFVSCAILNVLYVIFVGGDYHHSRMFLPALFAICAPVAVVPAARRHLAGVVVAAWAVIAVVSLRPDQLEEGNWLANGFLAPRDFGEVTREEYGWGDGSDNLDWYRGPAYYFEAGISSYLVSEMALREEVALPFGAFWGIGISAYSVGPDFHVLDQMGLADSFAAHLEGQPSLNPDFPRFPGHEKPMPTPWLAARVTPEGTLLDPADFPPFPGNPLIPPTTGAAFEEQVAWARATLRCEGAAQLLASAQAPLTPRRFAANLLQSVGQTRLRIDPDPEAAYHQLCGADTPTGVLRARAAPSG